MLNRKMTKMEKELSDKISVIFGEVESYIKSNPDWVYYFIDPIDGIDNEINDCVMEHPDDWNEYIDFSIVNVTASHVVLSITTDEDVPIRRTVHLLTFNERAERNKMLYEKRSDETEISNLENNIERLAELLKKNNRRLEELKKKIQQ